MKKFRLSNTAKFILSVVICLLAGAVGSIFTSSSVSNWYPLLAKPSFNPLNWIFAPVWTTLFVMMAVSLYFVWSKDIKKTSDKLAVKSAISFFRLQLVLNIAWSMFFFGMRSPLYAFIDITLLWFAILITIIKFNKVSKPAALLLLPYIIWISFAVVLNLSIVLLNA